MAAGVYTSTFNYALPQVRYSGGYGGGSMSAALSALAASGTQRKKDIRDHYTAQGNAGYQSLINSGLTSGSVGWAPRALASREAQRAIGAVDDSISGQRSQLYAQQAQFAQQRSLAQMQLQADMQRMAMGYALSNQGVRSLGPQTPRYGGIQSRVSSGAMPALPGSYSSYVSRYR